MRLRAALHRLPAAALLALVPALRRDGTAPASGHTLLVLQRTGSGWRIVHDASL